MISFFLLLAGLLLVNGLLLVLSVNKKSAKTTKPTTYIFTPKSGKVYELNATTNKLKKAI
ncbi:hypothetical protein [Sediminicola luteus]|uniref:Uncharacterized protein n=1 Tax=Sediminicola luteus TaxID=319238 RepID=A0A2A4G7A2_9FLAO|nr:hypothetical protein [Sediminicola luteus]PCE64313.1 hypothetical protein B7P33_08415 [Sediminicola luteus]